MRKREIIISTFIFIFGFTTFLFADFSMTWKSRKGEVIKCYYKNINKARLIIKNSSSIVEYYIIGKKTYMVTEDDGKKTIQDMDEIKKFMSNFKINKKFKQDAKKYKYTLIRKKGYQNINGIKGERWLVKHYDFMNKKYITEDMVITKRRDIMNDMKKYSEIYKKLIPVGGMNFDSNEFYSDFAIIKDKYTVLSDYNRKKLSSSLFKLPSTAKTEHIKNYGPQHYVKKKEEKTENEVKHRADQEVDRTIKKGINKIFNSIFK